MRVKMVELHVHLRGTIHGNTLGELASKYNLDVDVNKLSWSNFREFLDAYHIGSSVIRAAEDYKRITYEHLVFSASEGTLYSELMVSPDHAEDTGISYCALIEAISEGIDDARATANIDARIIVTCVRHRGPTVALELARRVLQNPHPMVTGFGMAGDEKAFPPSAFAPAFAVARAARLGLTCHAGEFCSPTTIWETTEQLNVSRLGHGVRAVEDSKLLDYLVRQGIIFELCPSSNLALGLYPSPTAHPIRTLFDAGCRITLNTDDPAFFDSSLWREYQDAIRHWAFTESDLNAMTLNAIDGAFCDPETKQRLRDQVTS